MVSILLDKLGVCESLMVTDGDEDTMALLIENQVGNDCTFDTSYLLWGEHEDFASDHQFDILIAADVIYEDDQIEPLLATVMAILKGECHPGRAGLCFNGGGVRAAHPVWYCCRERAVHPGLRKAKHSCGQGAGCGGALRAGVGGAQRGSVRDGAYLLLPA